MSFYGILYYTRQLTLQIKTWIRHITFPSFLPIMLWGGGVNIPGSNEIGVVCYTTFELLTFWCPVLLYVLYLLPLHSKLRILLLKCRHVYILRIMLRINTDYFLQHHKLIWVYNDHRMVSLRGWNWRFFNNLGLYQSSYC